MLNEKHHLEELVNLLNKKGYSKTFNTVLEENRDIINQNRHHGLFVLENQIRLYADDDLRAFFDLFYFNKELENIPLNQQLLKSLSSMGILHSTGRKFLSNTALYPFQDNYFFADPFCRKKNSSALFLEKNNLFYEPVYMGFDSFLLAEHLNIPEGAKVLDMCCGSGIHSILCAQKAKEVYGVDINKRAIEFSKLNALLNKVSHKIRFLDGDMYEPIKNETFDFICSNPPYVMVPPDVSYSIFGNGGADGMKVARKVITGIPKHLKKNGEAIILLKITKEPIEEFENLRRKGYRVDVKTICVFKDIEDFVSAKVEYNYNDFEKVKKQWLDYYKKNNVKEVKQIIVRIQNNG